MARIHALLVGINEDVAVTQRHGCVADVTAVETLLRSRVAADTLSMLVLRDDKATRAGIIDGFRTHLKQAVAGDIALFYYCGHGSEETCPPEWLPLEPSTIRPAPKCPKRSMPAGLPLTATKRKKR